MATSTIATRKIRHYGWHPDLPDQRDLLFSPPRIALPLQVDLRSQCPPIYDQSELGSCTANAIAGALEFDLLKQGLPDFMPSRLFIYYNERVIEGDPGQDNGAQIRDGMKSVNIQGFCPETAWPYVISQFSVPPNPACYQDAEKNRAISYQRVARDLLQMKTCLAAGYPFVFGFSVYESFESPEVTATGVVPMPASGEKMIGGHACVAVGYDDASQRFYVRNSWGASWGMAGYFTMPYPYLTQSNLSSDFWTVRVVN